MSSASRAPGDKPEAEDGKARPASPGRYSLSTEGSTEMAAVRIDSTRSMAAARPEDIAAANAARAAGGAGNPPASPSSPTAPMPAVPSASTRPAPITVPPPAGAKPAPPAIPGRRGTLPQVASGSAGVVPPPSSSAAKAVAPPPPSSRGALGPKAAAPPAPKAPPAPAPGTGAAALASARPESLELQAAQAAERIERTPPAGRPATRRPPPPSKQPSVRPPSMETFEGFDEGSIAAAFDELMSEGTSGLVGTNTQVDLQPVRELFAELAANHMRHVRDFMIDVKWGEAPREWIEICIPAVASLRRAAERLDIADLATGLDAFAAELKSNSSVSGGGSGGAAGDMPLSRSIEGETKERLLESYDRLAAILPTAFALDRDKSQREAVIIQSLCLSVPDVRKVTIDKLHAAGLTSLKTLFDAKPDEVAQVAGIPEALAVRIVERFQEYRRELANASPQDARAEERERLATLTGLLREQHDGYEEAANGWSPEAKAKKRDLFRMREETWLSISLLLARFGEVERIQGIERVPFVARITQLTEYLEEARQKYRAE